MNGRLYDPKLHRFLQPDNFVQDSSNTQNYNRYGYCWNNPFKYTDESGEIIWFVVAYIAVSAAINVYQNWDDITGGTGKFSDIKVGKLFGYTASGAISGALTVYGGPYGVIWASGAQNLLNSATRGDNIEEIGKQTLIGLGTGAVSYGAGQYFDNTLPNGLFGGTDVFNKVTTGIAKEVFSASVSNFSYNFYETGDFNKSLERTFTPRNIIQSSISGAVGGYLDYKTQGSNLSVKEQTKNNAIQIKNNLELQIMPYILPTPSILPIPIIPPTRTVIPPTYTLPKFKQKFKG